LEAERFKLSDILYGFIVPMILVLLIFVLAVYVNPNGEFHVLGDTDATIGGIIAAITSQGFAKMIVLGIPLLLGLTWNKWAGGAAGFIMGGMYYVAMAGKYSMDVVPWIQDIQGSANYFGDISMLFYLVNAVIIGYMAGALSGGSMNFKRMLGAALTAGLTTAVIQAYLEYNFSLEIGRWMSQAMWDNPLDAFVKTFIPSILLGVIIPILAKVMSWYGLSARKQY